MDFRKILQRIPLRPYGKVLIGIMLCNIGLLATVMALIGLGNVLGFRTIIISWSFFPVSVLAIIAKDRRIVLGCLLWLIALYPLSVIW